MMIKAIIFDCFGVFYTDQYTNFIEESPVSVRPKMREIMAKIDLGEISREDVVRQYTQLTGVPEPEVEQKLFSVQRVRNQKLLDYSQELRKKYKIGILSNASPGSIDEYFSSAERTQFFDAFVVSSEVNLIKPWPEIFWLACDRLAVAPNEAVFVDDNPINCDGARKIGMQAILYEDFDQLQDGLTKLLAQ